MACLRTSDEMVVSSKTRARGKAREKKEFTRPDFKPGGRTLGKESSTEIGHLCVLGPRGKTEEKADYHTDRESPSKLDKGLS